MAGFVHWSKEIQGQNWDGEADEKGDVACFCSLSLNAFPCVYVYIPKTYHEKAGKEDVLCKKKKNLMTREFYSMMWICHSFSLVTWRHLKKLTRHQGDNLVYLCVHATRVRSQGRKKNEKYKANIEGFCSPHRSSSTGRKKKIPWLFMQVFSNKFLRLLQKCNAIISKRAMKWTIRT